MPKIDTSKWGDFRVGDLFTIKSSKSVDKTYLNFDPSGIYDFIGRTSKNNGVQGKLNQLDFPPNELGTYSVTQIGVNVCQYRENKWYSSQNIFILTPINRKVNSANKFISTVITTALQVTYGEDAYSSYPTLKTLSQMLLKFPVDSQGAPDWQYMENYMYKVENKVNEAVTRLEKARNTKKNKIDTSKWGDFRVGDLFDAERGKVKNLQALELGDTPVITAARANQGVAGNYNIPHIFENRVTVSCNGACGSTFYHPYKFNINSDAIVLTELNPMADRIKQFIACILDSFLTRKYSYEEKCSVDKVKAEIIKLPIDSQGNPDWQYMEDYMRKIEEKAKTCIKLLK